MAPGFRDYPEGLSRRRQVGRQNPAANGPGVQARTIAEQSRKRRLLKVLQPPDDEQPEREDHASFPPDRAQPLEVSCSS